PEVGRWRPSTCRSRGDLPEPDSPSSTTTSPTRAEKLTPPRAVTSGENVLVAWLNLIASSPESAASARWSLLFTVFLYEREGGRVTRSWYKRRSWSGRRPR